MNKGEQLLARGPPLSTIASRPRQHEGGGHPLLSPKKQVVREQEEISAALESAGDDMEAMQALLDRLEKLNAAAIDLDVNLLDKKIDQMMPELGFGPADNDRLVASFSGGWQMRMCLGKMLLQVGRRAGAGAGVDVGVGVGVGVGLCACVRACVCMCEVVCSLAWLVWALRPVSSGQPSTCFTALCAR